MQLLLLDGERLVLGLLLIGLVWAAWLCCCSYMSGLLMWLLLLRQEHIWGFSSYQGRLLAELMLFKWG